MSITKSRPPEHFLPREPVDFTRPRPYPRRPEKLPRRPRVTIAAGFVCLDGVVLCADSEHTAGQSKFYEQKIFEIKANNALLYLVGAGDYVYIRAAAQEIESCIKAKDVSLDQIKITVEDAVSELHTEHLAAAQQAGDTTATLGLLLAVWVRGQPKALLYRVVESGGIARIGSGSMALGTEAAESVLREQADLLYRDYMSVYTLRHLGPHIIRKVCKFAAYCGGSPQVACLEDTGPSFCDNSASADPGEDYLSDVLTDLPDILECCISPTAKGSDFEAVLRRFNQRVSGARERRKRYLGQGHPVEANGWDW